MKWEREIEQGKGEKGGWRMKEIKWNSQKAAQRKKEMLEGRLIEKK